MQEYFPLCLYPTEEIIKILVRVPIMVVVMAGSEEMVSPSKLQETERGRSPRLTLQVTWTNSPSLTESMPNEKGVITGGSENHTWYSISFQWQKFLRASFLELPA